MPEQTPTPPPDQPHDPWLVDRLHAGEGDHVSPQLGELFAAATAPATAAELAGEAQVRSLFEDAWVAGGAASKAELPSLERTPMRSTRMSTKLAAAIAVGSLTLVGVGAAALGGTLPGSRHDAPHSAGPADDESSEPADDPTVTPADEPTVEPTEDPTEEPTEEPTDEATGPVGPDATGPAAYGLCNAYLKGGLSETSTAYANLVTAAGGEENLDAYCATVPHPGKSDHPGKDDHPGKTDHPSKDDHPGKTDHPGKPEKSKPEKSKPAKTSPGGKPSKPTQG